MLSKLGLSSFVVALTLGLLAAPRPSLAASVDLEVFFTHSWDDVLGGEDIKPGKKGNKGTGIPFDFQRQFVYIKTKALTLKFPNGGIANPKGTLTFYTLINTGFGTSGALEGKITFRNNFGEQLSFKLIGNENVRDYNPANFTNDLSPDAKPPALEWYVNGEGRRLDVQVLAFPKSWKGTNVVSMKITGNGPNEDAVWLSAVTYLAKPKH